MDATNQQIRLAARPQGLPKPTDWDRTEEPVRDPGVAEVVASRHPDLSEGDHVTGLFGVQEYATVEGGAAQKIDPSLAPLPVYLGALGMTGLTAYFGLLDVGAFKEGETVAVS